MLYEADKRGDNVFIGFFPSSVKLFISVRTPPDKSSFSLKKCLEAWAKRPYFQKLILLSKEMVCSGAITTPSSSLTSWRILFNTSPLYPTYCTSATIDKLQPL